MSVLQRSRVFHMPDAVITRENRSFVEHLPRQKDAAHTNFCDITVRMSRGHVIVLACLDNLIRGASGVAAQNFT